MTENPNLANAAAVMAETVDHLNARNAEVIALMQERDALKGELAEANEFLAVAIRSLTTSRQETAQATATVLGEGELQYYECQCADEHAIKTHSIPMSEVARFIATIDASRAARDADRELFAQWMLANGYATGHGDDVAGLLVSLNPQHKEMLDRMRVLESNQRTAGATEVCGESLGRNWDGHIHNNCRGALGMGGGNGCDYANCPIRRAAMAGEKG